MKNSFFFIICIGMLLSCQKTILVDLNESPPRLAIDAKIVVADENKLNLAEVTLSTTIPFFESHPSFVNNASVKIIKENGDFVSLLSKKNGKYSAHMDIDPNKKYTLEVIYDGETYTATEQLEQSVPLEYVKQINNSGLSNDDIELRTYFNDPAGVENYYFLEEYFDTDGATDVISDQFFDGNLFFVTYISEDLRSGHKVHFRLYGVDKQFYNYMSLLMQQTSEQNGSSFSTRPATVHGNIVNQTNPENFAFGYFRISEVFTLDYTVK